MFTRAVVCVLFYAAFCSCSHQPPRIEVRDQEEVFRTFAIENAPKNSEFKLVKASDNSNIYAGWNKNLYVLNPKTQGGLTQVSLEKFATCSSSKPSICLESIDLLKEGRNGYPLFICGNQTCCDVKKENNEHVPENCDTSIAMSFKDPSLHIGNDLYYALSEDEDSLVRGLYRLVKDKYIWPLKSNEAQRFVKIIANSNTKSLAGKVYTFYIEKNISEDQETPLWLPYVSQNCMVDEGGSKDILQRRWTSLLKARLFCGDLDKRVTFTELLDIAVVEMEMWNDTMIYALFKNPYNGSAVCMYKMSDIIGVFSNFKFKGINPSELSRSSEPGKCVEDSRNLPPAILRFMKNHPEMGKWINQSPLLVSHHHYTHLQVDRVQNSKSNVLLMSLESGKIHKVLDDGGKSFIIAEYHPFKEKTHIHSMLLDQTTKKMYVSSSNKLVEVDLQACGVYGNECSECTMARDPYCVWSKSHNCSNRKNSIQDMETSNSDFCSEASVSDRLKSEISDDQSSKTQNQVKVSWRSKTYLKCPITSHLASYTWYHNNRKIDCASTNTDCLLLIDSVSEGDEGDYRCVATENNFNRTVTSLKLQMNNGSLYWSAQPVLLVSLLLMIFLIC